MKRLPGKLRRSSEHMGDEILRELLGMDDESIAVYGASGAFGKRNSNG